MKGKRISKRVPKRVGGRKMVRPKRAITMGSKFSKSTYTFKRMGIPLTIKYDGGGMSATGQINTAALPNIDGLLNTYDVRFGIPFSANQATDFADFSSLFDRYRIVGVKLQFIFDVTQALITGAGTMPWITIAQDYDDAALPTNEANVLTKQYAKTKRMDKPFTIYLRPKPQLIAGQVAGTTSNSAVPNADNLYFNCTDSAVVFYGLKGYIRGWYSPIGAQSVLRIQPTYYLALKDTQ